MNEANKPWLSVIIPIYNAEKYLSKCLKSIQNQTFKDFEVIMVDDGSKDNSGKICKEFESKDKRFHYYKKENGGPYQTRFYGIEKSKGTYFTGCDADDYYSTKKAFQILYDEVVKSNCAVIQFSSLKKFNHLTFKEKSVKNTIHIKENEFYINEYPKLLCSFWDNAHISGTIWNKIYHRDLINNLPSSESAERVFMGDDLIFNLYALENHPSFCIIPHSLYVYRDGGGSKSFVKTRMKDLDTIKKYQLMFLKKYQGQSKDIMEDILYSEIAGWFLCYIREGLEFLKENDLKDLINESLNLPRFVMATQFFRERPNDKRENICLLRNADADEYIKKAKEKVSNKKNGLKEIAVKILKQI